jgi:2,5-diketo-D-gluconate reductase B
VAEWLGWALQKLLQRFESARDLYRKVGICQPFLFCNIIYSFGVVFSKLFKMEYIKRAGAWIPKLGFGTFNLHGREALGALEFALDVGYRHFDTAQMYENESEIGTAMQQSHVPRDRLFLTNKVWGTNLGKDRFMPSVEASLKKMKQDYVDLLLIHWPNEAIPLKESLEQLQLAQEKQLCKFIGVSNFTVDLLDEVRQAGVEIVCNQFEYHAYLDQEKLLEKTRSLGAFATAYCPLAKGQVADDEVLTQIAAKHRVSAAQVALRWLVQQESVIAIPKSRQLVRLKKNFDIFNFTLSEEEIKEIDKLRAKNKRFINPEFAPQWDTQTPSV